MDEIITNYTIAKKIMYSKDEYLNGFKFIFYNPNVEKPMTLYTYYINNCKLLIKKDTNLLIALPNNDKLISSIDELDKKISEKIKLNVPSSILKNDDQPIKMLLNYDTKSLFFSTSNIQINPKSILTDIYISVIIELTHVIQIGNTINKYWRIKQAKQEIAQKIKINDILLKQQTSPSPPLSPPPPPQPPQPPQPPPPPQQSQTFIPSVKELNDKINKLNKINIKK